MRIYVKGNKVTPDKTYQNKRNPNKFIETKKYNDGHTVARQYMKWDTSEGEVKNYNGSKTNRGRYHRMGKNMLNDVLDDYDEIESTEAILGDWEVKWAKPTKDGNEYISFFNGRGDEVGYIARWNRQGDTGYTAFAITEAGDEEFLGSFMKLDEAKSVVEMYSTGEFVRSATEVDYDPDPGYMQGVNPDIELEDLEGEDNVYKYIQILDAYPEYQEDDITAASVPFEGGSAEFWQLSPNQWKLVILKEDEYNEDTFRYENDPYWGTEELRMDNVNDIILTSDDLYSTLAGLPGADLYNFYGLRQVIEDFNLR